MDQETRLPKKTVKAFNLKVKGPVESQPDDQSKIEAMIADADRERLVLMQELIDSRLESLDAEEMAEEPPMDIEEETTDES